ncbi:Hypothetical protein NTJ_01222 [Nesidiocoris tenuis]|uniref:Uncharacterized protein n=1 Tax=Nesidiocoris tenuis TaxID=355587 RepID=A0ABN7A805_9HEMI|nr:Hypothetical protein NTJ_01222 [Nesidiocoris tenuis]
MGKAKCRYQLEAIDRSRVAMVAAFFRPHCATAPEPYGRPFSSPRAGQPTTRLPFASANAELKSAKRSEP